MRVFLLQGFRILALKKYGLEIEMQEKLRVAMFGHKRWSREGSIEVVVKELCTRMAQNGCLVTCYKRSGIM